MTDARPSLHVVAAVLRDLRGRVLLAQRPEGKADAGLWEFPGGKVEPGETALDALARELREELGIDVDPAALAPLIRVPVGAATGIGDPSADPADSDRALPHVRLRLDCWIVPSFEGLAIAHEHAALAWVPLEELARFAMPQADRPVVAALAGPDRLLITPEPAPGAVGETVFIDAAQRALDAGLRRVQLRMAPGDPARTERLARALAPRARAAGAALHLHGLENAGLALELRSGLHLRARELDDPDAIAIATAHRGAGLPLSAAAHSAAEIRAAEALGVDDLLLGPVHATPTHPGQPGLGWAGFEALRARTALPVWALGGVGPADLAEARRHGAQGVAGIRAYWPEG